MICLNCRKQIADDAKSCPYCNREVNQSQQLVKEISYRRYQRWGFYGLISIVFLVMLGSILKMSSDNNKLILQLNNSKGDLNKVRQEWESAQGEIEGLKKDVDSKTGQISQLQGEYNSAKDNLTKKDEQLTKTAAELESEKTKKAELEGAVASSTEAMKKIEAELEAKADEIKKAMEEKVALSDNYEKCRLNLDLSDANVYSIIVKLGVGVSNGDLSKIVVADSNIDQGEDTDKDGLSDMIEESIGTSKDNPDTDNDGYGDKDEILKGFNPKGEGRLGISKNYTELQKGKILLQVEGNGEAWYVAGDGKRYFLGRPADAFSVMRSLDYWTGDWKKRIDFKEDK